MSIITDKGQNIWQNAETQFKLMKFDFEQLRSQLVTKNYIHCKCCFELYDFKGTSKNFVCRRCIQFVGGLKKIKKFSINDICTVCFNPVTKEQLNTAYFFLININTIGPVHQRIHLECHKQRCPELYTTIDKKQPQQLKLL